jgi:hypothetical protein
MASVGVPHTDLLAYWHCGTFFGVLDSAIHPDALTLTGLVAHTLNYLFREP